jgi:hypothetical protein
MAIAAAGPQRTAGDVAIIAEHPAPPVVMKEMAAMRRGPKKNQPNIFRQSLSHLYRIMLMHLLPPIATSPFNLLQQRHHLLF